MIGTVMDSSPPAPDPGGPPAPGASRLETIAEQSAAIDMLVDLAQARLCVFDRNLAEGGWDSARRAEGLAAFLRRSKAARISIIVHDARFLEASCPRILGLLKVYSHALEIWRTGPEAQAAQDALVIADQAHCLHRYHVEAPPATLTIAMPQAVKPLITRFEEIWATGEPALGGSVLGL